LKVKTLYQKNEKREIYMGAYDEFTKMTPAEKAVVAAMAVQDPVKVYILKESKQTAFNEATRRFGHNGHNDSSDAFRHCFWSAILTRDIGIMWTKLFTDAHESVDGQPADEKAMDLHNNGVGMDIGFWSLFNSNLTISNKCFNALQEGKLTVLNR
jgi:hypothetical protein